MENSEKNKIIQEYMEELLDGGFVLECSYSRHWLTFEDGIFMLKNGNDGKPRLYKTFAAALKRMEGINNGEYH